MPAFLGCAGLIANITEGKRHMKRFKRFAPAVLLAASGLSGQFAYADPISDASRQVIVAYADLDLTHTQKHASQVLWRVPLPESTSRW